MDKIQSNIGAIMTAHIFKIAKTVLCLSFCHRQYQMSILQDFI